jgi:hypothetical protein
MANSGKMLSKKSLKEKNFGPNEPRDLFIDMQVTGLRSNAGCAFERTGYFAVERTPYGRPQITARASRVRCGLTGLRSTLAMRVIVFVFERRPCVRTHIKNYFSSLHVHFAPLIKM